MTHRLNEINWCFRGKSIAEIKENLKWEGTTFSQRCLDIMNQRAPISLELTLRLMREAKISTYTDCLYWETKVALNRVWDKDFVKGVEFVLGKNEIPKWSPLCS